MSKQLVFSLVLIITIGVFMISALRIIDRFRLTRPAFPVRNIGKRFRIMLKVAFGQSKIFRKFIPGLLHALVFWGFLVILFGSIEMVVDGLLGTDRIFRALGPVYDALIALGDIFALIVGVAVVVFLFRRLFLHIGRFSGKEMGTVSHLDANIALSLILLLMVSLIGMNGFYVSCNIAQGREVHGLFPVSAIFAGWVAEMPLRSQHAWHEACWWVHISLIFVFANYLPYSKHFHVFMSVPNVFLSRLESLGKLNTMEDITREVKIMMDPDRAFGATGENQEGEAPQRFGVLDIEDITWKNYFDSLACTECGRCTSVCPANLTGKLLSPRKIMMDVRARMKEKAPGLIGEGREYSDQKSLLRGYVTEGELWACTTCNACAMECPININQPELIVNMRRYLVMEESAAPGELNSMFQNIENNGAPWQFSREDRMLWAEGQDIPLMSDQSARGHKPEYLFWVGSAGAFDDRYKQVTRSFVRILSYLNIDYAVLGSEESSTGDVARRAGNEMLFQMQALANIDILNGYGVEKILTCDPHAYNTFLNEYPDLGGKYRVLHHSRFLAQQIRSGKLRIDPNAFMNNRMTYHDPCYLGRINGEYDAPRAILQQFSAEKTEMPRNRSFALCCGAGGGQMFKEAEKGEKEVFLERAEEAMATGADIIVTACPYCMVMMTDGLKYKNVEQEIMNFDIAELVARALKL